MIEQSPKAKARARRRSKSAAVLSSRFVSPVTVTDVFGNVKVVEPYEHREALKIVNRKRKK